MGYSWISDKTTKKIIEYLLRLIPKAYRDDPSCLNVLARWLLVGILIRLILMPFAFHGDLLSTYHRSYLLVFESSLRYLNPQETIQAIFLPGFSFFIPLKDFLVWSGSTSVSISHWLGLLDNANIFSIIFLLKIPYFIFDIAICILFLHIFRKEREIGTRVFIFWILNPIIIFSVYIFGRYEVIPIFFILLSIFCIKENYCLFGGLSLGLAIISRYYALFILPLFLIVLYKNWNDRAKYVIFTAIPVFTYTLITKITSGSSATGSFTQSQFVDYLFGLKFVIQENGQVLYVFIILYICVILFVYYKNCYNHSQLQIFASFSLIVFLLFYSTSHFHPQYFTWFIPFLAMYYGYTHDEAIVDIHCLQIICFIIYTFYWQQSLASWMFASVNPEILKSLPPPIQFIDYIYPALKGLNIVRSVLSAISIFMIIKIIMELKEGFAHED